MKELFGNSFEIDGTSTKVEGFGDSKELTNKEIGEYIESIIPTDHLSECDSIEYSPELDRFDGNTVLGTYEVGSHDIDIADEAKFPNEDEMLDTIVHEIGHNAQAHLETMQPEFANTWTNIHNNSWVAFSENGMGFVSDYARTNRFEDFAESYCSYIRDPDLLKFVSPEKYNFMKENVFSNEIYFQDLDLSQMPFSSYEMNIEPTLNTLENKESIAYMGDSYEDKDYVCFDKIASK